MYNCKYVIQIFAFLAFLFMIAEMDAQSSKNINDLFLEGATLEWNRFYNGSIAGAHDCELQLAFDGFNCKGFLTVNSSNEAFILEGSLEGDVLQLVEKHKGLPASYINGKLKDNLIDLKWEPIGGDQVTVASFVSKNDLNIKGSSDLSSIKMNEKGSYYDFFIDKRINLPNTKHAKFQKWIQEQTSVFEKEINKKIKNTNLKKRSQILAVVDHKLFFESEEFINGVLIFYSSWSEMQKISFVYDLKSNKEVKFNQLILDDSEFEKALKQLIIDQDVDGYKSVTGYNEWLSSASIQNVKVTENGLKFSTAFDPIYGQESVEMNCEELKTIVKKNYLKKLVCKN